MAVPIPASGEPTQTQSKAAKVKAIKETMAGITAAKKEQAAEAAKVPQQLKGAFEQQAGATKLGIQSQLAQQLAQQEGMGAGYNKAAARQAAATAGLQTGAALGQIGVTSAKEQAAALAASQEAKTEAAAQLYEQLTGEEKLDREVKEEQERVAATLATDVVDTIKQFESTGALGDDDEDGALSALVSLYNEKKTDFDNNPAKKKELIDKVIGITKEAIEGDYDDLGSSGSTGEAVLSFLNEMGVGKQYWDDTPEYAMG